MIIWAQLVRVIKCPVSLLGHIYWVKTKITSLINKLALQQLSYLRSQQMLVVFHCFDRGCQSEAKLKLPLNKNQDKIGRPPTSRLSYFLPSKEIRSTVFSAFITALLNLAQVNMKTTKTANPTSY